MVSRTKPFLFVALIAISLGFNVACDPGQDVRITNQTAGVLRIIENGREIDQLVPGEHKEYSVLKFDGVYTYQVKDSEGQTLASRSFSWADLRREKGISIVVR